MEEQEKQLVSSLSSSFGINYSLPGEDDLELFRQLLAERIAWLIDHRIEFLFQVLYRMDVDEKKVNEVFPGAHAAEKLADLCISRAAEKIAWRQRYSPDSGKH